MWCVVIVMALFTPPPAGLGAVIDSSSANFNEVLQHRLLTNQIANCLEALQRDCNWPQSSLQLGTAKQSPFLTHDQDWWWGISKRSVVVSADTSLPLDLQIGTDTSLLQRLQADYLSCQRQGVPKLSSCELAVTSGSPLASQPSSVVPSPTTPLSAQPTRAPPTAQPTTVPAISGPSDSPTTARPQSCADNPASNCQVLLTAYNNNLCTIFPSWTRTNCPQTCNYCAACEDDAASNCPAQQAVDSRVCDKYPEWAIIKCPFTCNQCSFCEDNPAYNCPEQLKLDSSVCTKYELWARTSCPVTCKHCNVTTATPIPGQPTRAPTGAPTIPYIQQLPQVKSDPHAFTILNAAKVGQFTMLKVRFPAPVNGEILSASENWCRDYQNLCGNMGLRPTGCADNRGGNYRKCSQNYNSKRDFPIEDPINCHPYPGVKALAWAHLGDGSVRKDNSFAFVRCATGECDKTLRGSSTYGLLSVKAIVRGETNVGFTLCTAEVHPGTSAPISDITASPQYPHALTILNTIKAGKVTLLKVRFPASVNGEILSATENWCRDYQNLCEGMGLSPTGCAGKRGSDYRRCELNYNSKRDFTIADPLNCYPAPGIKALAWAHLGEPVISNDNCFAFGECSSVGCSKTLKQSTEGLHNIDSVISGQTAVGFTVCV